MHRLCFLVVAWSLMGCSFDGSEGARVQPVPDPAVDAAPDAAFDAAPTDSGPTITCSGFTKIGASHYLFLNQQVQQQAAEERCSDYPGAHLATFELVTEPADVATGLALTVPVWTSVVQEAGALLPGDKWVNKIGATSTPLPPLFPWRTAGLEPNDNGGGEDGAEDFAHLLPVGTFDDVPANRNARILCECAATETTGS